MLGRPFIVLAILVLPLVGADSPTGSPIAQPYQPARVAPSTMPVAIVHAFQDEPFVFTETVRTHAVQVPLVAGSWDRVILEFRERPFDDPWDRTFGVAIDGVEVLHGTTPRTDFTIRKDITGYAGMLAPGATANVSVRIDTWAGSGQLVDATLEFYQNEPTKGSAETPWTTTVPVQTWRGMCGGDHASAVVQFPDNVPSSATIEFTLSGHGTEEQYFLNGDGPRVFHVTVDGTEVARDVPMPYLYAFIGFTGGTGNTLHPLMWWTAQRALDSRGVHTGVGEIPSDRASVDPAALPLLTGARTVDVYDDNGGCVWITSVSVLLR